MRPSGLSPFHGALMLAATTVLVQHPAHAIDAFEIQVYDASVNEPFQPSLEVHYNNVLEGRASPSIRTRSPPITSTT